MTGRANAWRSRWVAVSPVGTSLSFWRRSPCSGGQVIASMLGIANRGVPVHSPQSVRGRLPASLFAAMALSGNAAVLPITPGEYYLTIETVLPHLEEVLRYATTRTHQCLREPDVTSLFPLLTHQAFAGCRLVPDADAADGMRFTLRCKNAQAASGTAAFEVGASYVSAILDVKMGGKNMTLSQRLYGLRLGSCLSSDTR